MLLKLHGSTNWLIEEGEYDNAFSKHLLLETPYNIERVGLLAKRDITLAPNDNLCPLIIPPITDKPIATISLFTGLWSRASEYLEGAKTLVICGYSLPEADVMAKTLFRNVRNSNVADISVVDPDGTTLGRWKDLLDRNVNRRVRWHYFKNFSAYVEQECG